MLFRGFLFSMSSAPNSELFESLQHENEQLRCELAALRQQLKDREEIEKQAFALQGSWQPASARTKPDVALNGHAAGAAHACAMQAPPMARTYEATHGLQKHQIERYSRQLLLPSFGLAAQEGVCSSSVLIVGCGGLGSPAALYLAAAGVGTLGLVDHDVVETSNLHRQIIHTEARVGEHKALSARAACLALNSTVKVQVHEQGLTAANALDIVRQYDVVIDCSDNPPTRYLVSDVCVVAGRPLVSAAAVGTDGQLTVYHHGPDGPCYRCLFPESPAPENCSRCSDAGVLGVVPGVMGSLQALEAIKIISGKGDVLSKRMLIFDALAGRFMAVKLRSRNPSCAACGDSPSVTEASLPSFNYMGFTGQEAQDGPPPPLTLISEEDRLLPMEAKAVLEAGLASGTTTVILDVRPKLQFDLMHLPGSINVPIEELDSRMSEVLCLIGESAARVPAPRDHTRAAGDSSLPFLVICRRGNASQMAVQQLRHAGIVQAVDVIGGLTQWAMDVDLSMPVL